LWNTAFPVEAVSPSLSTLPVIFGKREVEVRRGTLPAYFLLARDPTGDDFRNERRDTLVAGAGETIAKPLAAAADPL
jgi:hypothetical protein